MEIQLAMPSRGQRPDPSEACHRGPSSENRRPTRPPVYYPSNAADARVVNAVTGEPYSCKVGSKESLRLFRVTDASGRHNSEGYRIRRSRMARATSDTEGKSPNTLYYSTPQEYQQHAPYWRRTSESEQAVQAAAAVWAKRVMRLFPAVPTEDGEPRRELDEDVWNAYKEARKNKSLVACP